MRKQIFSIIGLAALMSSAALADVYSGTLSPSTTIANNCIISSVPLVFPGYDPLSGLQVDGSATFTIQCTDLMSTPNIMMDHGANGTGAAGSPARKLKNTISGTDYFLNYQLYSDAPGGAVWEGATGVPAPTADGTAKPVTVYGRIAATQNVPAGTYGDTVQVSVTF